MTLHTYCVYIDNNIDPCTEYIQYTLCTRATLWKHQDGPSQIKCGRKIIRKTVYPQENWIIQMTFDVSRKPTAHLCHPLPFITSLLEVFFSKSAAHARKIWNNRRSPPRPICYPQHPARKCSYLFLMRSAFHAVFHIQPSLLLGFQLWESEKKSSGSLKTFFPDRLSDVQVP